MTQTTTSPANSDPVVPSQQGWSQPPPLPPGPDLTQPIPARPDRRPGWRSVIAIGAGAAVLSSLLTAGAVTALQSGNDTASSTVSAPRQSAPPVVTDTTSQPNWVSVAAAVEPSVVSVQISSQGQTAGEGSGVVLDAKGHILTNNHVVSGAGNGNLSVVLSDGRSYAASVVGTDPSTDLAVIALQSPPDDLVAATFGDSDAVRVGDPVMALGNPLGLSDTVTTGIVSALDRPVTTSSSQSQNSFGANASEPVVTNAIQTDAAVNPGNSGGALVDGQGRVIGITSSIASLGASMGGQAGSIGLGFAIPANEAKAVAEQLLSDGTVEHAYLGVSLADGTVTVDGAQRRAATISAVTSGTPAADADLKAGDAVIAVNGEPLDGAESLIARIRAAQPGSSVELTVVRDGTARTVPVTLAVRPAG